MAASPSHRFGQIIGDLLEEIMAPELQNFCNKRGLYLDKKGIRGDARSGKKVSWIDKYGNSHDLDFVIEKAGSHQVKGRPLAFIEAAWRRYTKHSRNKVQEIQGAILPIADQHGWDKPFLGVILAGVFTSGSLNQMKTSGFEVALFPYDSIISAFETIGINAKFDETTSDEIFQQTVTRIDNFAVGEREKLKRALVDNNQSLLTSFFSKLQETLDRQVDQIILIPLHGQQNKFDKIADAISFVNSYNEEPKLSTQFQKYEVIVRYSNSDKIEASFHSKEKAIGFLNYIEQGVTA